MTAGTSSKSLDSVYLIHFYKSNSILENTIIYLRQNRINFYEATKYIYLPHHAINAHKIQIYYNILFILQILAFLLALLSLSRLT